MKFKWGIILVALGVFFELSTVMSHAEKIETESAIGKSMNRYKATAEDRNVLAVLIEFEDVPLTYEPEVWGKKLFSNTEKSLVNYFQDETGGLVNVVPAKESNTSVEGVVKVKLNRNHPDIGTSVQNENRVIVKEALEKLDSSIDFSKYDKNNNGFLEGEELHIITFVAGYNQSGRKYSVVPHNWGFDSQLPLKLDGVSFYKYSQVGEKAVEYNPILWRDVEMPVNLGVICHEFGHDLGLPDLHKNQVSGVGLGRTSLMSYGSYGALPGEYSGETPIGLDAYSKMLLGMPVKEINVESEQTITVDSKNESDQSVYKINTANPQEYFLIDNRQLEGYDAGMSTNVLGSGIGIYKINELAGEDSLTVTLLEADEGILGYSNLSKGKHSSLDPFYYKGSGGHGSDQQTTLAKDTTPSTRLSDGSYPDYSFEILSENSTKMDVLIKRSVPVESIELEQQSCEMTVGESISLKPIISPENASNKGVSWDSSDKNVATVDETGKITAKKAGVSVVTVTTVDGNHTAQIKINVKEKDVSVESVSLDHESMFLEEHETKKVTEKVLPENATNKKVTWRSSDSTIVEVDQTGLIRGIRQGSAEITVVTEDGQKTATCKVVVGDDFPNTREEAEQVDLDKKYTGMINYAKDFDYVKVDKPVSGAKSDLTIIESTQKIQNVYLLNEETGKWRYLSVNAGVLAHGKYYYNVSDIFEENKIVLGFYGETVGEYEFVVKRGKQSVPSFLNKAEIEGNTFQVGETIQVDATTMNGAFEHSLSYQSSDTSVAKVDGNGLITAVGVGTTTIWVSDVNYSGALTATISVGDDFPNTKEGAKQVELDKKYTGVINYAKDFDYVKIDKPVSGAASDLTIIESTHSIQTIHLLNEETGKWRYQSANAGAFAHGKYYYSVPDICKENRIVLEFYGTTGDEYEFVIKRGKQSLPNFHNKAEIEGNTFQVGETIQLEATAMNGAFEHSLNYRISDTSVAKVDENGLITAVGVGKTTIWVSDVNYSNEVTATISVGDDFPSTKEGAKQVELDKKYTGVINYAKDFDYVKIDKPVSGAASDLTIIESTHSIQTIHLLNEETGKWRYQSANAGAFAHGKYYYSVPDICKENRIVLEFYGTTGDEYEFVIKRGKQSLPNFHNKAEIEGSTFQVGETIQVEATAMNGAFEHSLNYRISDTSVAKVDENGLITAVGVGKTTVWVSDVNYSNEVTATLRVD